MLNLLKNKIKLAILGITLFDTILLFLFTLNSVTQERILGESTIFINKSFVQTYSNYRKEKIVGELFKSMDETKKVGQVFMLSIPGTSVDTKTKELIQKYNIGGIALLGGNISNEIQLKTLTSETNDYSAINPLIAVDQEGGMVNRISWDKTIGKAITLENMRLRSSLISSLGINTNLAPVVDIPFEKNSFIKNRALGNSIDEVSSNALVVLSGHEENKVITSAKHFPGHGRTTTDSHKQIPIINISKEELDKNELVPFKRLIDSGVPTIMTGHLIFPNIDDKPTSVSKVFQTDILRGELGFSGLIISDDMNMGGIKSYPNRFELAIKAGTNMIIYLQSTEEQIKTMDSIVQKAQTDAELRSAIENSVRRVLLTKCKYKVLEECK